MGSAETLRRYHQRTKHTPASVRAGGRMLDWQRKPDPFKPYPGAPRLPLPEDVPASGVPALRAVRSAARDGRVRTIDDLGRLLWLGAGAHRPRRFPGGEEIRFRTYASAGALYPNEIYAACGALAGVPAGLHHFDPAGPALERLRDEDARPALVAAAAAEPATARADVLLAVTAIPWRTAWKYGDRGYRHVFWDAGMILSNILALAGSAGIPARVVLGFDDTHVETVLGLDGRGEFPIALVALGAGDRVEPAADAPAPAVIEPAGAAVADVPGIIEANDAGRLDGGGEVERWRGSPPDAPRQEADEHPLAASADGIEETIVRRGSARGFRRTAMPAAVADAVLAAAHAGAATDVAPAGSHDTEVSVIVHAVEGLTPGVHRWDGGVRPVREGSFRGEAGVLCLEQRAAADAALCCFLLTDLDAALGRRGGRAYRLAQLQAGIVAGRIYLGAYAYGYGATGLTFYDDEVTRFLGEEEKECMLVVCGGESRGRPDLRPLRP